MAMLENIRLKRIQFEIIGERFVQGEQANCEIRAHCRNSGDGRAALLLEARFFENHPNPPFRFEIAINGFFLLNKDETPELLAKKDGTSILFPYLRDEVVHLTLKAGLPPIVLPPFRINTKVQIRDDLN